MIEKASGKAGTASPFVTEPTAFGGGWYDMPAKEPQRILRKKTTKGDTETLLFLPFFAIQKGVTNGN
mgnify:CR=1 FL=1